MSVILFAVRYVRVNSSFHLMANVDFVCDIICGTYVNSSFQLMANVDFVCDIIYGTCT